LKTPEPRKGMPDVGLSKTAFIERFKAQYQDPAFDAVAEQMDAVAQVAWDGYIKYRKAPRTRKAGPGYADPAYDLSIDWIAAKDAIGKAQAEHDDQAGPTRILLINASSRSEHTCPGEMSKSYRLLEIARDTLRHQGAKVEIEVLNLSDLASEYGRKIHPCKACFSTAAALCHWPCSCYPNHAMGQTQDWMNDIYPMWTRAHGVMIVTPVNWYQATSPLKLMMDRLVCADGGNADPTLTQGKDAKLAKAAELKGWTYDRHLAGRVFSVVAHGDTEGAEGVRRIVHDWLTSMELIPAGAVAELDRYIGYWDPYATSHDALDGDKAIQEEVRNCARALLEGVIANRAGKLFEPGAKLRPPREK
jgi:multimeric flavodoxin WrbA